MNYPFTPWARTQVGLFHQLQPSGIKILCASLVYGEWLEFYNFYCGSIV